MQGGEAARLGGLRQRQGALLGGLRHRVPVRLGHRAYLGNRPGRADSYGEETLR
jgi:hypothetical protein